MHPERPYVVTAPDLPNFKLKLGTNKSFSKWGLLYTKRKLRCCSFIIWNNILTHSGQKIYFLVEMCKNWRFLTVYFNGYVVIFER